MTSIISKLFLIFVLLIILLKWSESVNLNSFETRYIEVPIDHFAATPTSRTFKLRYLINSKNDANYIEGGPIFLYTGGEREITIAAQNTGFLFEIAPLFKALLIFVEHRYYGTSLPFGNASFTILENLRYLNTKQALADFALLIQELKNDFFSNYTKTTTKTEPIIAIGGYYAGTLSALLRMKYPHLVRAALTSSAPLFYLPELTSCEGFYQRVTQVFERYGSERCVKSIKLLWDIIENLTKSKMGMTFISSTWKLCKKLETAKDVQTLVDWLRNIFTELSIANYPYASEYYNPVPAYPVMTFCNKFDTGYLNDTKQFIESFANALQIYTNYTGKTSCNNIYSKEEDLNDVAWKYQICTELIMPKCSTEQDMFLTYNWTYEQFALDCYKKFGVRPRPNYIYLEYGIPNLKYFTNILFSSSALDPASWGVVDLKKSNKFDKSLMTLQIIDAPHLMEFRGTNTIDNDYILQARKFYISILKKWLK
ncbi:unnamed protein product [Psylliodes chrysocephalus]|uniref:Lysosomal Pro-X carboxypeptidase n=1 Tax=Psylliodes chrysocephalus TaxID=3402493 RepID=A0A9P0GFQ8_9CUCU|nr:unnamed protein product [Psylliodes chrysocephala]